MATLRLSIFEATLISTTDSLLMYIVSFWSLQDIITCQGLSLVLNNIMRYYTSRVWNPDVFFQPWFKDDPVYFRELLQQCGAVVSGSQITQLLDRARYPGSDMDIFLRVGGLGDMGTWLQDQGYAYVSQYPNYKTAHRRILRISHRIITERNPGGPAVQGVFNYQRFIASTTTIFLQKIQLIAVDTNPIQHVLFDFHSTCVMNFMTFDAVISIFPLPTFILHKSYVLRNRDELGNQSDEWKSKYRDRGFRIVQRRTKGQHHDLVLGKRSIADKNSWIIKLAGKTYPF
ncbi:hypothetical protein B0H16DRAFT_1472006 [Mycena metata]|uniref:Uncharacterized protein n=1 Tax=Mycena metata TaxID=1033252 RepID=A0AAD7MPA9_9AGAR|nr:hypothetical protein B0H16DRAFT_1472006 [Mycena metata]